MCGRLRVGKENLHVAGLDRCSHVFGLLYKIRDDARVDMVLVPIGDRLLLARRRPSTSTRVPEALLRTFPGFIPASRFRALAIRSVSLTRRRAISLHCLGPPFIAGPLIGKLPTTKFEHHADCSTGDPIQVFRHQRANILRYQLAATLKRIIKPAEAMQEPCLDHLPAALDRRLGAQLPERAVTLTSEYLNPI